LDSLASAISSGTLLSPGLPTRLLQHVHNPVTHDTHNKPGKVNKLYKSTEWMMFSDFTDTYQRPRA